VRSTSHLQNPFIVNNSCTYKYIKIHTIHHRAQDRVSHSIRIGLFSSPHRLPTKIVQHNLWPIARRSELVLKRARFLYALIQRISFCLCKHIMLTMLEMRDEHQTGLPFACLVMRMQNVIFFSLNV
jgi:hypothetical protein